MAIEGKARAMGHPSTEMREERKNKSNGRDMAVEETVGTALRCRPFFAAHKVRRPTLAKTATHRSGSLALTLQNEMRTRTNPSCAACARALSCAKQPGTCRARAGLQLA